MSSLFLEGNRINSQGASSCLGHARRVQGVGYTEPMGAFITILLQSIYCPVVMKPCLSNGSILLYCTGFMQNLPVSQPLQSPISTVQKSTPESLAPFPIFPHGADPSTPRGCFAAHRSPNGPRHAILCEPAGALCHPQRGLSCLMYLDFSP